jgi:hypothetical protein
VILSAVTTSIPDSELAPSKEIDVAEPVRADSGSESCAGDDELSNSQDQTVDAPVPGTQGKWVNVCSQSQAPSNEISETVADATN